MKEKVKTAFKENGMEMLNYISNGLGTRLMEAL